MLSRSRARRWATVVACTVVLSAGAAGCRTTNEDVQRWANTSQGPRKLVSVVTHDKYPQDLRISAALTLIGMKPRAGRRVGIERLMEALNSMPEQDRQKLIGALVPRLVDEIGKPASGTGETREDTSVPYKDAAYAMLTNDGGSLVTDPAQVAQLRLALRDWVTSDFAERMDDSSQMFGVEQLLRWLGPKGVEPLPKLIEPDYSKTERIADLVADLGDEKTRLEASKRLVAVAKEVNSEKWLKTKAPKVEAANAASKLSPTEKQFRQQLEQYQEEELLRVFASMKKVAEKPVVDYLLEIASDKAQSDKRRATALAALEGNLDKDDTKQLSVILDLAGAEETPDAIRDVALRRVGEMPRKLVVDRLYRLFNNDNWKIRWVAAELVLRMSDQSQLDEFMSRLGRAKGLAITEPLRYGALISELKGKTAPEELAEKYSQSRYPTPVRLSALGYFYDSGNKSQLADVERYASDATPVPECLPDAKECEWKCTVAGKQVKEIKTVGDFVEYCVKPAMQAREKTSTKKGEDQASE